MLRPELTKTYIYQKHKEGKIPADFRLRRLSLLRNLFLFGVIILLTRAAYLQVGTDHYYKTMKDQRSAVVTKYAQRGLILDRNGHILANNVRTYRVTTDPSLLKDHEIEEMISKLPQIYKRGDKRGDKKLSPKVLRRRISNKSRRDALIWRHATQKEVNATKKAIPHKIFYINTTRRVYPKKELAGALLGFVRIIEDPNNSGGQSGIEQAYNYILQGSDIQYESHKDGRRKVVSVRGMLPNTKVSSAGQSIKLTIDMRIQQITEAHLRDQVNEMEAKSGVAVVMDPHTGDILALAQVPIYDPNEYFNYSASHYPNRAVSFPLEPGSTIKPFLVAAALNEDVIRPDTKFSGHDGRFRLGEHWIRDSHAMREMSTLEVIKYSSNIGAIQIAQQLGKKLYYSYLKSFGFGDLTHVGLNNESRGRLRSVNEWGQVHLGTFSYGYGFSATPLQIAQAMCVIANGGKLIAPRLVKEFLNAEGEMVDKIDVQEKRRVISKSVASAVTRGLVMVTKKGGTGVRSQVEGYMVAGKTGTAHKIVRGKKGYQSDLVSASFVGFVPAYAPRLVMYINIDEPQVEHYGGKVAAPVFSKIAAEVLPFLGVQASQKQKNVSNTIQPRLKSRSLKPILDYKPWWSKDRFLMNAPANMIVPELRGKDLATVFKELKPLSLDVQVTGSGVVISQYPEPGELLPKNRILKVTLERPSVLAHTPTGAPITHTSPLD